MRKIVHIADAIYGVIPATSFEKEVLATAGLNRLHDVLQNSTAFLTYPSCRTSRFSHSLGVMHLAGQVFAHGVLNAAPNLALQFVSSAEEMAEKVLEGKREDIVSDIRAAMEHTTGSDTGVGNFVNEWDRAPLDTEPLYVALCVPPALENKRALLTILWQAVRLVGLLHDVGHPPFSHVTEGALKELHGLVLEKDKKGQATPNEQRFLALLKPYADDGASGLQLHERITVDLAGKVLRDAWRQTSSILQGSDGDHRSRAFSRLVVEIALAVLQTDSGHGNCHRVAIALHDIVDGALGTDRLDYTVRDTVLSGMSHIRIPYERLIVSTRLAEVEQESGTGYRFCPDTRSISIIEQTLQTRWLLWKFLICHHRVKKTDGLLRRALVQMGLAHFESASDQVAGCQDAQPSLALPTDISGLWFPLASNESFDEARYALAQWSDSWLTTVLRNYHFRETKADDSELQRYLSELLCSKKIYFSVVKRMNDFEEIDVAAWSAIGIGDDDKRELGRRLRVTPRLILPALHAMDGGNWAEELRAVVQKAVEEELEKHGGSSAFLEWPKLKTGLEKMPYVYQNGRAVPLDEVTTIDAELRQNRGHFPLFFVYGMVDGKSFRCTEFRRDLGRRIGEALRDSEIVKALKSSTE